MKRDSSWAVGFAVVLAACASSDIVVPSAAAPDPASILAAARQDRDAGRFQEALEKHIWFHENALQLAPNLRGVRLSFALSDWHRLGLAYPPALAALEGTAAVAESRIRNGSKDPQLVIDLANIRRQLGTHSATASLFAWLDENDAEFAADVYGIVEPDLVRARAFVLCGRYLDPVGRTGQLVSALERTLDLDGNSRERRVAESFAYSSYINGASTLVALLVVNSRVAEADEVVASIQRAWTSPELKQALASARAGVVPEPWPPLLPSPAPRRTWR